MKHTPAQEIAQNKFDKALKLIERAQHLLSDACGELCPLVGAFEQWQMAGKGYDQVHQLWRDIAYSVVRSDLDLDEDAKASLAKAMGGAN